MSRFKFNNIPIPMIYYKGIASSVAALQVKVS